MVSNQQSFIDRVNQTSILLTTGYDISDEIVLLRVSKPIANTLNICYDVFLYDM